MDSEESFIDGLNRRMAELTRLSELSEQASSELLRFVQKDMTGDEKMQINNPNEYYRLQKLKQQEPITTISMSELAESLKKCRIDGNVLHLPSKTDGELPNYGDVRTALLKAGAKYKSNTFIFPNDAQPYIDRLTGGESVNIAKQFQFYPTPTSIAKELIALAEISNYTSILEPSAGQGAIIKAIHDICPSVVVDYCELMGINQTVLSKIKGVNFLCDDFLKLKSDIRYDRIIANPPFQKNSDIDHIKLMFSILKKGGILVSIASKHWQLSNNKKETEFRQWLEDIGAEIIEIEKGAFKESGTMISSLIIVINKK